MLHSTKQALWLAVGSAALAVLFYWWWGRLVVGTFAICVGGEPASGVDCHHSFQLYAAALFAAISAILFLVAAVRAVRSGHGRAP